MLTVLNCREMKCFSYTSSVVQIASTSLLRVACFILPAQCRSPMYSARHYYNFNIFLRVEVRRVLFPFFHNILIPPFARIYLIYFPVIDSFKFVTFKLKIICSLYESSLIILSCYKIGNNCPPLHSLGISSFVPWETTIGHSNNRLESLNSGF